MSRAVEFYGVPTHDALLASLAPAGWWKLNDAALSTTAVDSSGHGLTGTVNATTTFQQAGPVVATPADKAALFDGTAGSVACPSAGAWPTAGTVMFWMNPSRVANFDNPFSTAPNGNGNNELRYEMSGGAFGVVIGNALASTPSPIIAAPTTSTWYFIATTWSGTTATAYVNGAPAGGGNIVGFTAPTTALQPSIGVGWNSRFFNGVMAQVAVFTSALTSQQIAVLYARGLMKSYSTPLVS